MWLVITVNKLRQMVYDFGCDLYGNLDLKQICSRKRVNLVRGINYKTLARSRIKSIFAYVLTKAPESKENWTNPGSSL